VVAGEFPPNDEIHVNSENVIMSGELPAPLPDMPDVIVMPDITFPEIDSSDWPDIVVGRDTMFAQTNARLMDVRSALNEQYDDARATLVSVRNTTNELRAFVGDPQTSVSAQSDARSVTVTGMAQEMAQSVSSSMGYVRAVSNLGPLGLDLVFIFIGLGWILFMNLVEWVVKIVAWIVRWLWSLLAFLLRLFELFMALIRTLVELIPFW